MNDEEEQEELDPMDEAEYRDIVLTSNQDL